MKILLAYFLFSLIPLVQAQDEQNSEGPGETPPETALFIFLLEDLNVELEQDTRNYEIESTIEWENIFKGITKNFDRDEKAIGGEAIVRRKINSRFALGGGVHFYNGQQIGAVSVSYQLPRDIELNGQMDFQQTFHIELGQSFFLFPKTVIDLTSIFSREREDIDNNALGRFISQGLVELDFYYEINKKLLIGGRFSLDFLDNLFEEEEGHQFKFGGSITFGR